MKPEKVFVRYKNLNEAPGYNKERTEKRPNDKKKYAQKTTRPRQALKIIYESFQPTSELPTYVQKLLTAYPKFFNKQGRLPEKDSTESLNQFLILNRNKFMDVLKEPKKQFQHQSSSDPDWNSNDEIDSDMESRKIDQTIVEKIVEKLADRRVKKAENLKPHQKRFLEDYYRQKRIKEQQQNDAPSTSKNASQNKNPFSKQNNKKQAGLGGKQEPKNSSQQQKQKQEKFKQNIWSQYQNRQVNTFVNLGFMTKIEDNQEEIAVEVAQDDGMFNQDSDEERPKTASQPSEESLQEDDIFGDEHPITTTIKTKHEIETAQAQSEKKITQGTVVINDHLFSKIAQKVGLLPIRCNWIIKNGFQKFKVTTEYMDAYYRKEKMYQILPLISLNHSDFIGNDKVETPQGLQILKNYNYRLQQQYSYGYNNSNSNYQRNNNNKYKEKQFTHLKKT